MFQDLGDYTPAEIVLWMTERQGDEFARLGLPFAGLWGRPLHAIDCQGLFCETDKYCREAAPRAGRVCGAGKLSFPSFRAAARKAHPRSASQAVADGGTPGIAPDRVGASRARALPLSWRRDVTVCLQQSLAAAVVAACPLGQIRPGGLSIRLPAPSRPSSVASCQKNRYQ